MAGDHPSWNGKIYFLGHRTASSESIRVWGIRQGKYYVTLKKSASIREKTGLAPDNARPGRA